MNLVTKKCEKELVCPAEYVLNKTTGKCERAECPAGYTFNATLGKCIKSTCPVPYVWCETTKKCILKGCPPGHYLNKVTGACTKIYCRDGFVLEMKTNECVLIKTLAPPIKVDNSDLSYTDYVNKMMLFFGQLEDTTKTDIWGCGLNLSSASKRCERVHGTDACEVVTPTFVHKRCPQGFVRMGCCTCTKACPDSFVFVDAGLYCEKNFKYSEKRFQTAEECRIKNFQDCENIEGLFLAPCRKGFKRVGIDLCMPECPESWTDLGDKCLKPEPIELGTPFAWTNGDN
jgi:hypothetical protein